MRTWNLAEGRGREIQGMKGREDGAKSLPLVQLPFPVVSGSLFPNFPCKLSLEISEKGDGPGGGRGNCRGPPADYGRSWQTACEKGCT